MVPILFVSLSTLLVWKWPLLRHEIGHENPIDALIQILPVLPYTLLFLGVIMGCRYGNTGMTLTSLTLGVSYFAFCKFPISDCRASLIGPSIPESAAFLLPLNLAFFTLLTRRRLLTATGSLSFVWVAAQVILVALMGCSADSPHSWLVHKLEPLSEPGAQKLASLLGALGSVMSPRSGTPFNTISKPALLAFLFAFAFVLVRYLRQQDVLQAGFIGVLATIFLAVIANDQETALTVYFFTAALTLIVTSIESSFSLAYTDELTGLPSRRSLNQTLANLGRKYVIGMVDVDHFKKFNDRYGHKTGDQVLKMVASRLQSVSGGAKSFRYGGEEFAVIYPGKTAAEAVPYLEECRETIAATSFIVRAKGRRKNTPKNRGKDKISPQRKAKITVSIGVATHDKDSARPEQVLKAADKKLYEAKKAGRNRVIL
jgi:diguanylate cyclase (GGDEF)-like protein